VEDLSHSPVRGRRGAGEPRAPVAVKMDNRSAWPPPPRRTHPMPSDSPTGQAIPAPAGTLSDTAKASNADRATGAAEGTDAAQDTDAAKATNIVWHHSTVSRAARQHQRGHRSAILWFTGLSGAGKSTLANAVNSALFEQGLACYVLDGDNVRHGLCKDLGFSDADREENIRRIGEVAKLFVDAGVVALTAFVSPFKADRDRVRALVEPGDFIEIHCAADLDICERRDTKGLYARARAGEIKDFTGISSPYEAPDNPELRIDTGSHGLDSCVTRVLAHLEGAGIIPQAD